MPLPEFTAANDLPTGLYQATLAEVVKRFGGQTEQRESVTQDLSHIHALALRTECLSRFIVFGSYVTTKPAPNDVDIILVMTDAFHLAQCPSEAASLFDHSLAQARHGASIFWIKAHLLMSGSLSDFLAHWQIKRDGSRRGIIEVVLNDG